MLINQSVAVTITLSPIILAVFLPIYQIAKKFVVGFTNRPIDLFKANTLINNENMHRLLTVEGQEALPANFSLTPPANHATGNNVMRLYGPDSLEIFKEKLAEIIQAGTLHPLIDFAQHPYYLDGKEINFTPEQLVYQAMRAWFTGRQNNETIAESFSRLIAMMLTEHSDSLEHDPWFASAFNNNPDNLLFYLLQLGMTGPSAIQILRRTASTSTIKKRPLSDAEFAELVGLVLNRDAIPAFRKAEILQ